MIATFNVNFSRTADRIATKFCMTMKKIKSNESLTYAKLNLFASTLNDHWTASVSYLNCVGTETKHTEKGIESIKLLFSTDSVYLHIDEIYLTSQGDCSVLYKIALFILDLLVGVTE